MRMLFPMIVVLMASASAMGADGTSIDLSPIWTTVADLAATVAAAVISTLGGYGVAWISKKINVSIPQATIDAAAKRAGGIAYSTIVTAGGKVSDPVVKSAALAEGLNHLLTSVPEALAKLGVDDDAAKNLVEGELGKLLASDPSVSAGSTTTATSSDTV